MSVFDGTRGAFALAESGGGGGGADGGRHGAQRHRPRGAALADPQATNFTFRAAARCVSRLVEMGGEAYEAAWPGRCAAQAARAGKLGRGAVKRTFEK